MKLSKKVLYIIGFTAILAIVFNCISLLKNLKKLSSSLPKHLKNHLGLDEETQIDVDCFYKSFFFLKNSLLLTCKIPDQIDFDIESIKDEVLKYVYDYYPCFINTKITVSVKKSKNTLESGIEKKHNSSTQS